MTIDNLEIVDIVYIDAESNAVLTITDHLEWDPEGEHILLLQEKLNTYLAFIESGELVDSFPKAKGASVVIDLICKYSPDNFAVGFLEKAAAAIKDAGFSLRYSVADADPA